MNTKEIWVSYEFALGEVNEIYYFMTDHHYYAQRLGRLALKATIQSEAKSKEKHGIWDPSRSCL
jgi:hypothetical protein